MFITQVCIHRLTVRQYKHQMIFFRWKIQRNKQKNRWKYLFRKTWCDRIFWCCHSAQFTAEVNKSENVNKSWVYLDVIIIFTDYRFFTKLSFTLRCIYAEHIRHRCKPLTHGRPFFTDFTAWKLEIDFSSPLCILIVNGSLLFGCTIQAKHFLQNIHFPVVRLRNISHTLFLVYKINFTDTTKNKWQFCQFNEQRENKQNTKIKMIKFKRNRKESLQIDFFFILFFVNFSLIKDSLWSRLYLSIYDICSSFFSPFLLVLYYYTAQRFARTSILNWISFCLWTETSRTK